MGLFGFGTDEQDDPFAGLVGLDTTAGFRKPKESIFENLFEKLNPLELLSLPATAVSEATGAIRAGEGLFGGLSAAIEGIYRGTDEARFPTMGEQLLPKEDPLFGGLVGLEDEEGYGIKGARLAVDIATDPLTLFGGPILKGVGKLAGPIAKVAGAGLARAGVNTQRLGRIWKSAGSQARRGPVGNLVMDVSEDMDLDSRVQFGKWGSVYDDLLKRTGLNKSKHKELREQAMDMLEDPDALVVGPDGRYQVLKSSGNASVDELARGTGDLLEEVGVKIENFSDFEGEGIMMRSISDDGTVSDEAFKRLSNYYPHELKADVLKGMNLDTSFGRTAAVARLVDKGVEPGLARSIIDNAKAPRKAGHIERMRTAQLPKAVLERDPAKVMPAYLRATADRLAFGDKFGLSGEPLSKMIQRMVDAEDLDPGIADEIHEALLGRAKGSALGLDSVTKGLGSFQVINKMGLLSTMANLSQSINTFISEGAQALAKGMKKTVTAEPGAMLGSVVYNRTIQDSLERMSGIGGTWGKTYLKWMGFGRAEGFNRTLAANAGLSRMETLLGGKITKEVEKELTMRGLTPELEQAYSILGRLPTKVDDAARLSQAGVADDLAGRMVDDMYKVGLKASDKTQHATSWRDMPLAWQSPEGKLFTQFKSFLFQQTRFVMGEIMKPAMKGNYGPLYRAAAGFGIGGPLMAETRDKYRQGMGWIFTGEAPKPRHEFDWSHPIVSAVADMAYVGGIGLIGDVSDQIAQGRALEFIAGPTMSDVADISQRIARGVVSGEPPTGEDIAANMFRRIPGRSMFGVYPSEVKDVNLGGARSLFGDQFP